MKKYLLLVILILITVMPVFSQAEPCFGLGLSLGGGTDAGFQLTIGLQFGVYLDSPFNFLLEANGGFVFKNDESFKLGFHYHLGGLIELRIVEILTLGAGGGMGGDILFVNDSYSYPYIRGSVMVLLFGNLKLGLYYDYGFKYGSMFGLRFFCYDG